MATKSWQRVFSVFLLLGMLFSLVQPAGTMAAPVSPSESNAPDRQEPTLQPVVSPLVSPADTTGLPIAPTTTQISESKDGPTEVRGLTSLKTQPGQPVEASGDSVLQSAPGPLAMPDPLVNFEGVNNLDGVYPPDPNGDVGKTSFIEMVNLHMAIYDKSGNLLYGPFLPGDIWPSGDPCRVNNDGDPIVVYDQFADRFLISQFALPNFPSGPYYQCIAISKTGSPTNNPNDWWPYTFTASTTKMNDYPKISVWPDAYYMTANLFTGGSSWGGAGVWAFDRAKMLSGQAATFQFFDLYAANVNFGGMLPVDVDGPTPPPTGAPGYFVEVDGSEWLPPSDALRVWEFHVDWVTPANSTFGLSGQPNAVVPVPNFDYLPCSLSGSRSCIPQPGTGVKLDSIGDRLMWRAAYRNFGSHESVVINHTVLADSGDRAGIRWYELRDPGGSPSIYQSGTYAPADGGYRWMASLAMDHVGNIGLGYSVSSSSIYPSIRYTGRLASDPLGQMPQGEAQVIAGTGSQTGTGSRWGDYTSMMVDPVDDCTFWYTNEYIQTTGTAPWQTRIASFKFPNCSIGPVGTLAGTVTDATSSTGIDGALIQATATITQTGSTTTNPDGTYTVALPVGTYDVAASAYGYLPATASGVVVSANSTTVQDFALTPAPSYTVSGVVTDAWTGWPLYAKIDIGGYPGGGIWTDPETGAYSVNLVAGTAFTFDVSAFSAGYQTTSIPVGPLTSDLTLNVGLNADLTACSAPGYLLDVTGVLEPFNATTVPPGWTVVDNLSNGQVWLFNNPGNRTNQTGGSGNFAIVDSDYYGTSGSQNTELRTPVMDLTSLTAVNLEFDTDFYWYSGGQSEVADVDVSNDGGTTWTNVWTKSGASYRGPHHEVVDITTLAAGQATVMVRYHYYNASYEWWWAVDNVFIGQKTCHPMAGGLVIGNVLDSNTSQGLDGAGVANDTGGSTTAVDTPEDPAVPGGYYTLFSPAGAHAFTASMPLYGSETITVTVVQSDTVQQDFTLGSGHLVYTPSFVDEALWAGTTMTVPVTLTNTGDGAATFTLYELDKGSVPFGPFEQPDMVVKPFKQEFPDALSLDLPPAPSAEPYAAGDVIQSWPSTIASAWPIAFDGQDDTVWAGDGWGSQDFIKEFASNGTPTGRQWSYNWSTTNGPADATYNWNTGMIYLMNINTGVANCVYEVDPASGPTGNRICPQGSTGFTTSQRGVAYDPDTDTYFAGGWNDLMVYRFAADGTIINSKNTGLAIAGLAYNPETQHLFVVESSTASLFHVLDVANNYAHIGQFSVPGFSSGGGAGLEIDCDGNLWAIDQTNEKVFQIDSGESASLCGGDVPWFSVAPMTGTLQPGASVTLNVTLDATTVYPGIYNGQIKFDHDTPYTVPNMPVKMTANVPATWGKIEGTVSTLGYCDLNPGPLADVDVLIDSASFTQTLTLTTDDNGYFARWMDQSASPLTITVNVPDYELGFATGVMLYGGQTTTQDFTLRWLKPCLSAAPLAYNVNLALGQNTTRPLRLTNAGAAAADYNLTEQNLSFTPALPEYGKEPVGPRRVELSLSGSPNPNAGDPAQGWNPSGNIELALDDGSAEDSIGLTNGGQFVWFNRFTPNPADFPFTLDTISVLFNNSVSVGAQMQLIIYEDTDGDGNPGTNANPLYSEDVSVQSNNLTTWNNYTLANPVVVDGPGDVLVAVVNRSGGAGILDYPAAIDQGASQSRSWVGAYTGNPPNPPTFPAPSLWGTIDSYGLPGNWTLRASGYTGGGVPADAAWLTYSPVTGTVPAPGQEWVTVGFDANAVLEPGQYKAKLIVNSNDPVNNPINVQATLNVSAPATWGILQGNVQSLGYCDANPAALAGATVVVSGAGGLTRSMTTGSNGNYLVWLPEGSGPYTVDVTEANHMPGSASGVVVTGGGTTTQDFSLRWLAPCLSIAPPALSVTVPWGGSASLDLTLTNDGAAVTSFAVSELGGGFDPLQPTTNQILVVNDGGFNTSAANAFRTALTNLGYTFDSVSSSSTTGIPAVMTDYLGVLYAGVPSTGAEQTQLIAYLDAGGRLLVADNDFGYTDKTTVLYQTYFEATYVADSGSDGLIHGVDMMAGTDADISSDPYPDSFTIGPDAVGIFANTAPRINWAGMRITRNAYRAVYFAWDFYYAGGSTVGDPIETEILGKVMPWLTAYDLPWLSETPTTGSVAPDGGTATITVDFDASVPEITQPGDYTGGIKIESQDTILGNVTIPVTMTVSPSATMGKLWGTVSGLGACDLNPAPLNQAQVLVVSGSDTYTLTTDSTGYYQIWVDASNPVLAMSVSKAEHVTEDRAVFFYPGTDPRNQQDFGLRWMRPCLAAAPTALSATVSMGMTTTVAFTVSNSGAGNASFTLGEADRGVIPSAPEAGEAVLLVNENTTATNAFKTALTNLGLTYLDVTASAFTAMDVGSLMAYDVVIYVGVPSSGNEQNKVIQYLDAGGNFLVSDNDFGYSAGTSVLYTTYFEADYGTDSGSDGVINGVDIMAPLTTTIVSDPYPDNFSITGPDAVGIFANTAPKVDWAGMRIARNAYKAIYLAWDFYYAGGSTVGDPIETEILARALGWLMPDVPWMDANPKQGTIVADTGTQAFTVDLDASVPEVDQPGTYQGTVKVRSNDPAHASIDVLVDMVVTAPASWGKLQGTVNGLGYCDDAPAPVAGADVFVEASTGMTWTLQTDASGQYQLWTDATGTPFTVTVTAADHTSGSASVAMTAGQTTTQDFSLRWLKPCVSTDSTGIAVTLELGANQTEPLTLFNDGAADTPYWIEVVPGGFVPSAPASASPKASAPAASTKAHSPAIAESGVPSGEPVVGTPANPVAPEDIGPAWETKAAMPAGRVFNAVIAGGDYVFVIGGTSDAGGTTSTNTNFRYDPATDTWATMAAMPAALAQIDGIEIDGKIYIPGDDTTATTYVYDIAADTWSSVPANGGYSARVQYQVTAIGTDLYVLGGIEGSGSTTEVWKLDTVGGTWTSMPSMQKSRTSFSAAAIDGVIYVAGGVLYPGFVPDMTTEKFDGTAWSFVANVPNGGGAYTRWSYNADGHGADGLWLAAGRRDAGWTVVNHAGFYNPETDTWTDSPTIPTLAQGRVYMEGDVASDGYFYVIGGRDPAGAVIYTTNERLMVGAPTPPLPPANWVTTDPVTGTLAADSSQLVDVIFDSSVVTQTGQYFATLRIHTDDPVYPVQNVPVTMTVATFGVELTPPTAALAGDPGQTVDYTLHVTNTGSTVNTFDLTFSGNTWAVSLPVTSLTLNPGEGADFLVHVTVPANALAGATDTVSVTATSQAGAKTDSSTLTTTAGAVYAVSVSPATDAKSALRGVVVQYTLHVTNNGNTTDTFDVTFAGNTWTVHLPVTSVTLAAGASVDVVVEVTIPTNAQDGDSDSVNVTVTSQGNPAVSDTSELTTTASVKQIWLPVVRR